MGPSPAPTPGARPDWWAGLLLLALRPAGDAAAAPTTDADQGPSAEELLAAWEWHLTERRCSPNYISNTTSIIGQFLGTGAERGHAPGDIDVADLDAFLRRRKQKRAAGGGHKKTRKRIQASTAHVNEGVVLRFTRWATAEGHLDRDPYAKRRPMNQPAPPERYVPRADIRRLRDAAAAEGNQRMLIMLSLAFWLGMRVGGIADARLEDIRPYSGRIAVRGKGYGGEISDWLPMPTELAEDLAAWTVDQAGTGPLIPSLRGGGNLTARHVSRLIAQFMRDHGVPGTAHWIRHTAAWEIASVSSDPRAPKDFLGHASSATTEKWYLGGRRGHVDDAVAARPGLAEDLDVMGPRSRTGSVGGTPGLGQRTREGHRALGPPGGHRTQP